MFDPRRASLRYRIASGRCIGVIWLAMGSAALVEVAARSKPDAIVLDLQHGLFDRRELEAAIGIVPPEIPVIVRVAENSPFAIGMALDAGAEGVMVPLVESAKQARNAVRYAKYPPDGVRSGGGVRPLGDFAEYVEGSDKIVVMVMIETDKGVKNARDIAAVDGVDMVFIGTGDLSLSIGVFPNIHHDHTIACAAIHAACKKAWTPCGIFTPSLDMAKMRRGQGYRMVVTANDMDILDRGFSKASTDFAATPPAPPAPVIEANAAPLRIGDDT
ncbi:MAG TPA: aldolase/citrate lyase family protein [Beijerinckiaceae bacterium]|nr:aldolase/citrate lyase family protein [Beijerinckiaceae bacterium]